MLDFDNPTGYCWVQTLNLTISEDQKENLFAAVADGDGMINAGIHNGDTLFFCKTDRFHDGEIVAVTVDGETMVRRIFNGKKRVKLRREIGNGEDTYATDYTILGRLVGIQREA